MFGVSFNIGESRAALQRAMRLLEDMTPVYADIGEYLIEQRRQRFVRGVDPDGNAWTPKSQATLDRYRRMGYGNLTRPLIGPSKALGRQIHKFVSRDGVVVGSSLEYSRVMQEGAARGAFGTDSRDHPIPWGRIPARRWIDLNADEGRAIVTTVDEHLEDRLGQGG